MKKIFISYRSVDKDVVNEILQFMENIGINSEIIMSTSADYTSSKYNLSSEVKMALTESCIVIVILSKDYFKSAYCCNELGYIWATNKNAIFFGLAGIDSPKDCAGFSDDWVIRRVNNLKHISHLYDSIRKFSKYDFIKDEKLTEYKVRCIDKINKILETKAVSQKQSPKEIYRPEKILDIDSLIQSKYYGDKELLFFKYLIDTGDYIWGIPENIRLNIQVWEKKNRLRPFLSSKLEAFLIMLSHIGYLSCKIISRKEWMLQDAAGKTDSYSKKMLAIWGANENGETEHNYFEIKEPLYRAIINANKESIALMDNCMTKYRMKWYQRYNKYYYEH